MWYDGSPFTVGSARLCQTPGRSHMASRSSAEQPTRQNGSHSRRVSQARALPHGEQVIGRAADAVRRRGARSPLLSQRLDELEDVRWAGDGLVEQVAGHLDAVRMLERHGLHNTVHAECLLAR